MWEDVSTSLRRLSETVLALFFLQQVAAGHSLFRPGIIGGMKVLLYLEGKSVLQKSGIGRALQHQMHQRFGWRFRIRRIF